MKKAEFEKIIKLMKPSFKSIEFGKVWYRAYFYAIPFFVKAKEYRLYIDLVQDCSWIVDWETEKSIADIDIENRKFLKLLQEA